MMHTEFLIIGQGISGTLLSWNLQRLNRSSIVIDNECKDASSRVAAGIINPVTGRRIVKTWMIDELMPFAVEAYDALGKELGIEAVSRKDMIDFFPSAQMLLAFRDRVAEGGDYLHLPQDQAAYQSVFNYDFGYGEISPCYAVNLAALLPAWRARLKEAKRLISDDFNISLLDVGGQVRYKDITAERIIFCDGAGTADNRFFNRLPFALNKGEALIIEAEGIPRTRVFKKALNLVPLTENVFWAGSSYEWNFSDSAPSEAFRDRTLQQLRSWLKVPFRLLDHRASVRPATIERRPFAGVHPHYPKVAILNGMGTKGCSLAPFFAQQLAHLLVNNIPVMPEADIKRFTRVLT